MLFKRNYCFIVFCLLVLGITVSSCDPDPIPNPPDPTIYGAGLYICNEGPFMSGTGTITYYDDLAGTVDQSIFQAANENQSLGSILQSLTFDGAHAYAIVNNANEIAVLDYETFEIEERITGFELPRYMLVIDDKGYVSQWGVDGVSGKVMVVDLPSSTIEAEIETGQGTERMLAYDDLLYVVNEGGFGRDSTVMVIDPATNSIVNEIVVGDNPTSIQVDPNGVIWTISKGYTANFYDPNDPANTPGQLCNFRADGDFKSCMNVAPGATDLIIKSDGSIIFFTADNQIMHFATNGSMVAPESFYQGYFYELYWDLNTQHLFAVDPVDFASPGSILKIDQTGELVDSFVAGIIPSFITRK